MSWDCPRNKPVNQRIANVAKAREELDKSLEREEPPEAGDSLMMKRVLVK
jgi:hypothetical protein